MCVGGLVAHVGALVSPWGSEGILDWGCSAEGPPVSLQHPSPLMTILPDGSLSSGANKFTLTVEGTL